ncbi:hypothetical protein BDP55DRAFT_644037 [Colletotrichum godetiae]|uniref:Uncharacterized protein n=1 Tax=Colletotrichum godetiae TaxID=1209918 RepID=A0AAJ0F4R8_9PEZI|nr:uncharacterized protein BDP55DRAFT_644037 [Colletotrichum godetiae]KAK1700741.1 hypothetical protein BDP55DRAFT_644037 [Colletotrichum godetiae]
MLGASFPPPMLTVDITKSIITARHPFMWYESPKEHPSCFRPSCISWPAHSSSRRRAKERSVELVVTRAAEANTNTLASHPSFAGQKAWDQYPEMPPRETLSSTVCVYRYVVIQCCAPSAAFRGPSRRKLSYNRKELG